MTFRTDLVLFRSVLQGQLSVEKELFSELLSKFKCPAIKVTHMNV
jgi:hypothetical protein